MTNWTLADIPDQTGRVFVVTGANSGLGLVTAQELAAHGAHVVLACRDVAKGEAAAERVKGSREFRRLDLADLDSVRDFAGQLHDWRIETLVNNAGIMNVPRGLTAQGNELHFGTNVLGHFLLTNLLQPRLTDRVVTLSSGLHRGGGLDLEDVNFQRRQYNGWTAYSQSKLADLIFAYELQRRLQNAGSRLRSVAAHPGYAATNLQSHSAGWQDKALRAMNKIPFVSRDAANGAEAVLYAATMPDLAGGSYIGPGGRAQRGAPQPVASSAASHDPTLARGLWDACEELTGQPFEIGG